MSCVVCGSKGRYSCPCAEAPVYCGDTCAASHWRKEHGYTCIEGKPKRDREEEESASDPETPITLLLMNGKRLTAPWGVVKVSRTIRGFVNDNNTTQVPLVNITLEMMEKLVEAMRNEVPDFDTLADMCRFIVHYNYLDIVDENMSFVRRVFSLIRYRFGKPFSIASESVESLQAFLGDAIDMLPVPIAMSLLFNFYLRVDQVDLTYTFYRALQSPSRLKDAIYSRLLTEIHKLIPAAQTPQEALEAALAVSRQKGLIEEVSLPDKNAEWYEKNALGAPEDYEALRRISVRIPKFPMVARRCDIINVALLKYKTADKYIEALKAYDERQRYEEQRAQRYAAIFNERLRSLGFNPEPFTTNVSKPNIFPNVMPYFEQMKDDEEFSKWLDKFVKVTVFDLVQFAKQNHQYADLYRMTTPSKYLEIVKEIKRE